MASAQFFILALGTLPPEVQVWDLHSTITLGSSDPRSKECFLRNLPKPHGTLWSGVSRRPHLARTFRARVFEVSTDMGVADRALSLKVISHPSARLLDRLDGFVSRSARVQARRGDDCPASVRLRPGTGTRSGHSLTVGDHSTGRRTCRAAVTCTARSSIRRRRSARLPYSAPPPCLTTIGRFRSAADLFDGRCVWILVRGCGAGPADAVRWCPDSSSPSRRPVPPGSWPRAPKDSRVHNLDGPGCLWRLSTTPSSPVRDPCPADSLPSTRRVWGTSRRALPVRWLQPPPP